MRSSYLYRAFRAFLLGGAVVLAGCSTTGNRFDTADLRFLVPGETTLQEASQLLQGDPVNVYRQVDGSATARWSHTATLATDAVYFNQELWLAFDPYGRFVRIVKSNNVPHANLYEDGRRADLPDPGRARTAMPSSIEAAAAPQAPDSPLHHTAVTYPLAR